MELTTLAEAVLFGSTLEEKLLLADDLTDARPGPAIEVPRAPGRPPRLRFERARARTDFPGRGQLDRPEARGVALHFFANHELLAMELMALVLLRFPDAPATFRLGLARTIGEEQAHLRLYRARMESLGVTLGDVPVNDFFWSWISGAPTPLDFVVRMSLTFEQANLDFARHYARLFAEVGDTETAAVLQRVYADEIGHVRHGATWLSRWKDPAESDWEAYRRLLPPPFTPARAKGPAYDREARLRAGLSETFADELEVFSASKGRRPSLWVFNAAVEEELVAGGPLAPSPRVAALVEDLAPLLGFLAVPDDAVLVPRRPSLDHLARLKGLGFAIPEFVPAEERRALRARRVARLEPWGESPALEALRAELDLATGPCAELRAASKAEALRIGLDFVASEGTSSALFTPASLWGCAARSVQEVRAALEAEARRGVESVLLKAPFSSSGRARLRVAPERALADAEWRWVERMLERQGVLVVEPRLDRLLDLGLSLQLGTDEDRVTLQRFFTDARGAYLGHLLAHPFTDAPGEVVAALHRAAGGATALMEALRRLVRFVSRALAALGVEGPAGIDLLVHRVVQADAVEYRLKPVVELNPRRTMGHVALALREHLAPGALGVWLHVSRRGWTQAGFTSAAALAQALEARAPVATRAVRSRLLVERGAVCTNDPAGAQERLTVLLVGRTLEECLAPLPSPALAEDLGLARSCRVSAESR
jgi:uncharacterized ferritin-like protein (DUF455 family)